MGVARRLTRALLGGMVCALVVVPVAVAAAAPKVSTGGVMALTTTTATLTGTVNPNGQATTFYFQYGTTKSYGNQAPAVAGNAGSGTTSSSAAAPVMSLAPNTTYHYRLVATNASGTTFGRDKSFTTAATKAPVVATGAANAVTGNAATLTGTVNPESQATTYYFQYGTTKAYGSQAPSAPASAGDGIKSFNVAAPVASLAPNTTYHYRLAATNPSGTTFGADKSFKTTNLSVSLSAAAATIVFGQTTTLSGTLHGPSGPHASVTLQSSASLAGPFVTVTTITADANGMFSFPAQAPSSTTFYRALAKGTSSAPVQVGVRFRVRCFVSHRFPRHGARIRFHGSVAPTHNGSRVQIQRLGAGRVWHTIASARLRAGLGGMSTYSINLKARTGTYRATVRPDADHLRGSSAGVKIRTH